LTITTTAKLHGLGASTVNVRLTGDRDLTYATAAVLACVDIVAIDSMPGHSGD
jgi:hypothetical protein